MLIFLVMHKLIHTFTEGPVKVISVFKVMSRSIASHSFTKLCNYSLTIPSLVDV